MALRIVYILIAAAAAFLAFDIYRLASATASLDDVPSQYISGPENADLTVVEFFSYGCVWCREIQPTVDEAIKRDGKIRYIPRAVISPQDPDAGHAAIVAYAAGMQGKFMEMHDEMMKNYRVIDAEVLSDLAARSGVEFEKLNTDVASEEIGKLLIKNRKLFDTLGGVSTPMFYLGGSMVFVPEGRLPTVDDFLNMFKEARASQ